MQGDDEAVTSEGTAELVGVGVRPPFTPLPSASSGADLTPGVLLADRYRIVALLGRGGMGEVYRADDLKLGQPVALKFLPRALEHDRRRLEGFLAEIRTARDVSHPNVCRVYDVGEADGRHFLSMEYVDGEDLASLVRRIGRLPSDKAIDIARQLCAGLAAAHDKGVLHRDLKPANVMLDGRGKVRLTDFGLAEAAGTGRGDLAGTPAYMAPEQFSQKPASVQSDLYALGLVLYEIFTGKRVFTADSIAELRRLHEESRPPTLTSAIHDADPAVERVILRCLEKAPHERPASALAVAAALPGGDPLAAALAAGETPSPAMVAASGEQGGMRPAIAVAWLSAVCAALVAAILLLARSSGIGMLPLPYPPDVLFYKAQETLGRLGIEPLVADSAVGFDWESGTTAYLRARQDSPVLRKDLATGHLLLTFWCRTSPAAMTPHEDLGFLGGSARVVRSNPPLDVPGMTTVVLDVRGRLLGLDAVPSQIERPLGASATPDTDWPRLLAETGIDPASAVPTDSVWLPPTFADARKAWTARYPDLPAVPLRIEVASYRGRPVYLRVVRPWTQPDRGDPVPKSAGMRLNELLNVLIIAGLMIGSVLFALRSMRLERGDRRGAVRVGIATSALFLGSTVLEAHHSLTPYERTLVGGFLGAGLFVATWVALLYLAIEPVVRRRWPHTVITWNRLLGGRLRDPLLGRDLLIGIGAGVGVTLLRITGRLAGVLLNQAATVDLPQLLPLLGLRYVVNSMFAALFGSIFGILFLFGLLFVFRIVLRRDWLMTVAVVALFAVQNALRGATPLATAVGAAEIALMVLVLIRLGLVAFAIMNFCAELLTRYPLTADLSSWHATSTLFAGALFAGIAIYAFWIALAGKPLLGGAVQD